MKTYLPAIGTCFVLTLHILEVMIGVAFEVFL